MLETLEWEREGKEEGNFSIGLDAAGQGIIFIMLDLIIGFGPCVGR